MIQIIAELNHPTFGYKYNTISEYLVINKKHTEVVFHKDVPIDESPSGWRIQTGQGEEGFEQYDFVKRLGKGAHATAYEVVNTKTGEHSAFKVYNVRA